MNTETMTEISTENVHLETFIMADMWRGYIKLLTNFSEYEHKTVHYDKFFFDEAIHTQNFEVFVAVEVF